MSLSRTIGRGHDRLFDYGSGNSRTVLDLLERYGPQRREQRLADMPFWRLKGDGSPVQNAEFCSAGGSRQPPKRELIEYNVAGGFDAVNFVLVTKKRKLSTTLAQNQRGAFPDQYSRKTSAARWDDIRLLSPSTRSGSPAVLRAATIISIAVCG